MRYFIDKDGGKVGLYSVMTCLDCENAVCIDAKGKEYHLPISSILEDDEPEFAEVSVPLEFPKEFVPSEKFDEDQCIWCPFYCVDEGIGCYCSHKYYENLTGCPIRKYFIK